MSNAPKVNLFTADVLTKYGAIAFNIPAEFADTLDSGTRCWCGYYITGESTTQAFARLEHRILHLEGKAVLLK